MTLHEQTAIAAWSVVAVAALFTALSKKCKHFIECVVVAIISLCAFAKIWVYIRQEIDPDGTATSLGVVLAIYFVMKADVSWSRASSNCERNTP